MTTLESIIKVSLLLLLALPIALVVLVRIFEDCPPTIGWLISQAFLMLGVPILLVWLSLFLIVRPAEHPQETSNVRNEQPKKGGHKPALNWSAPLRGYAASTSTTSLDDEGSGMDCPSSLSPSR